MLATTPISPTAPDVPGWPPCRAVRLDGGFPGRATAVLTRLTIRRDAPFPAVDAVLSTHEVDIMGAQGTASRRAEFAYGRYVAKTALSRLAGEPIPFASIDITPGVFRQPIAHVVGRPGLAVSITHDEAEYAAVAFPAGCPVGIDVHHVRPAATAVIVEGLTDAERAWLPPAGAGTSRDETAAALWAAREALGKALGLGLLVDPDVLEVGDLRRCADGIHPFHPAGRGATGSAAYPRFPPFAATLWTGPRAVMALAHPRKAPQ